MRASDVVQDVFCVAATKLGQLRDPTRVKPWLYTIARHEIFRRTKQRSRSTSLDALGDEFGMDPIASPDPHADGAAAESQELASLIRDAAYGLDPTDQLLLELTARQGLVGAELAAAIGVPVAKAHSMMFRMRERLERAVGAVVVTRGGRKRCEDLATVLVGWDGRFDVLWRKRISRHIEDCATCQETRKGAAVLSMAGFAPAFALPAMLRERTLSKALAAFGGPGGPAPDDRRRPLRVRRRRVPGVRAPPFGLRAAVVATGCAVRSLPVAVAGTMVAALVIVLAMVTLSPPTIEGSVGDGTRSRRSRSRSSPRCRTRHSKRRRRPRRRAPRRRRRRRRRARRAPTSTTSPGTTPAPPTPPPTAAPPPSIIVTPPPTVGTTPRPTTTTTTLPPTTTSTTAPATTTTVTTDALAATDPQLHRFAEHRVVVWRPVARCRGPGLRPGWQPASAVVTWSGRQGSGSNQLAGSGGQYGGQIGPFPALSGATYTVTLTVYDTTGFKASTSTTISVAPC